MTQRHEVSKCYAIGKMAPKDLLATDFKSVKTAVFVKHDKEKHT